MICDFFANDESQAPTKSLFTIPPPLCVVGHIERRLDAYIRFMDRCYRNGVLLHVMNGFMDLSWSGV